VTWRVIIRPAAESDVRDARLWYESQRPGLGDELLDAISHAVRLLEEQPERRPIYYNGFRRLMTRRFPYKIFYRVAKATASSCFGFCTPNGIIAGKFRNEAGRWWHCANR
jgi:plasmid stabilization system protein ParE